MGNLSIKNFLRYKKDALIFFAWSSFVFPFTFLGYGSDGDAWRVADNAQKMLAAGRYFKSRSMGFPLFEIITAPLIKIGHWSLSNAFVFCSGLVLLTLCFKFKKQGFLNHPYFFILSLAFFPAIVTNASSTMDYVPALTLIMAGIYFLFKEQWTISGLFIGIACGFRVSSCFMILPFILYASLKMVDVKILVKMSAAAFFTGLAVYSPVLLTYGIPLPFVDLRLDMRTHTMIVVYNFLKFFGIAQTLILFSGILFLAVRFSKSSQKDSSGSVLIFHLSNIFLWSALFWILPDDSTYLLPMLPSVLGIIDLLASRRAAVLFFTLLMSYHFVGLDILGGESGNRRLKISVNPGYTFEDIEERRFNLSVRKAATEYQIQNKTLLMYDPPVIVSDNPEWVLDPEYQIFRQKNGNFFVWERILEEKQLKYLKDSGFRLFVWKGRKWEYMRTHHKTWRNYVEEIPSLEEFFGKPLSGKPA